ncbi:hypothetical protein FPV67DRAFT_1364958, partial [Lyophyllum atratum]
YVASDASLSRLGWKREGMGNVLVNKKTSEKLVAVIVGEVLDEGLCCGPLGNFTKTGDYPRPLASAKNTFVLGKPTTMPGFNADWDQSIRVIRNWEDSIAMTDTRNNFVDTVGDDSILRFSSPCFEKGDKPLQSSDPVDEETANWPIPDSQRVDLFKIHKTHHVLPLPVYDKAGKFVPSPDANFAMKGALVEVSFTVKHYAIKRAPAYDSFSGIAEQVVVLQKGKPAAENVFRKNMRNGPVR